MCWHGLRVDIRRVVQDWNDYNSVWFLGFVSFSIFYLLDTTVCMAQVRDIAIEVFYIHLFFKVNFMPDFSRVWRGVNIVEILCLCSYPYGPASPNMNCFDTVWCTKFLFHSSYFNFRNVLVITGQSRSTLQLSSLLYRSNKESSIKNVMIISIRKSS